MIWHPLNDLWV